MTAPYTQQNYADWKARFQQTSAVGGLLRQAKQAAGIEEEPQALMAPPAPPQDPADLHEHKRGLLGGLRHLVGADRTAPEVAALLTPDQQKRARPGLLSTVYNAVARGKGPQEVQQERARQMLDLGDERKARDLTAQQEATARRIEAVAATMSPQDGAEYAARMKGIYGLPTAQAAIGAAVGLKEREFAPQRVTWTTVPMLVNGKQSMVMRSNDGQLLDAASGTDLREAGARMEPIPLPDTFSQMAGETPAGNIPLVGNRSGQVRDSGIAKPDVSDRTQAAVRREVSSNRAQIGVINEALAELAKYPEAVGLARMAGDAINQRVDPRGIPARAALSNIGSLRIHDRSGAAVTAKEFPRLRPFIPNVSDTYEKVKSNLEAMLRELESETAELEKSTPAPTATPPAGGKTITVNGKTFIIP